MYLRATIVVSGIVLLAVAAVMAVSRLSSRTPAGEVTMPLDWPVKEITVPATATDVVFDPDLRQAGGAAREVLRQMPNRHGYNPPYTGPWQVYFNDQGKLSAVFDHFEQPLLAAGYVKGTGRGEDQLATVGLADRRYTSADGKIDVQVRYWASPPRAHGGQPQHWVILITKR